MFKGYEFVKCVNNSNGLDDTLKKEINYLCEQDSLDGLTLHVVESQGDLYEKFYLREIGKSSEQYVCMCDSKTGPNPGSFITEFGPEICASLLEVYRKQETKSKSRGRIKSQI